ncbi:MAG: hypothetical protein ISR87_03435 [Candidatus Marinimicrobia bacterium]|nr:hypothetical protein [FCB group bacterium]MBL7024483.1 hypothetical protein [Candidatus Neomarinimicrobiota bacterium]
MYIVAIMITAVIFSATGLGVLNLATIVNLDTQNAVQKVQDQVEVESLSNVALWRVNTGADSLGTFTAGEVTATYDNASMKISVLKGSGDEMTGVILDLKEDTHFDRAVATRYGIDYNGKTTNEEPNHQLRPNIGFLPQVDMAYFVANAANQVWGSSMHIHDEDVVEGINIFYGNHLDIHNVDIENATLVFVGWDIELKDDVRIVAPMVNGQPLPAMVFTGQPDTHFDQESGEEIHIEGAIYSTGHVRLHEGAFTGPVVANTARICRDIDMIDDTNNDYYAWNLGFGNYEDYDWPKQIQEWARIN